MAERATVARPYARAAFALAKQQGRLAQWQQWLARARDTVASDEYQRLQHAPGVHTAELVGTAGSIVVPDFFHPDTLLVHPRTGPAETLKFPHAGRGWGIQAIEAMRCLRAGLKESPRMPLSETWTTMCTLDRIRAEIGLEYPNFVSAAGERVAAP